MSDGLSSDSRLVSFLLVEDDDDHAQLVMRTLKSNRVTNTIDRVKDGAEALDYLYRRGRFAETSRPDVILLDLKLPKVDGLEVLKVVKGDSQLKVIPVVVLTTSKAERDRAMAYEANANSYLVKPIDFGSFRKMAEDLNLYWGVWNQPIVDDGSPPS